MRARHNELLDIERSINELVIMIQDLDTMIIQQAPAVQAAEEHTNNVVNDLEGGNKQIDTGIKHALKTRKWKWICSGIVVLIILGIALGVGLGVGLIPKPATGSNSGNATKRSVEVSDQASAAELAQLAQRLVTAGLDLGLRGLPIEQWPHML